MAEGGEKTEEPTSKRLEEARKKGQIAVSKDLTAGAVFIVLFATLAMTAGGWMVGLLSYFKTSFALAGQGGSVNPHLWRGLEAMGNALSAPLFGAFAAAIAVGFLQTGGNFSFEALKIDPQRLMPDFKKLVSLNVLVEVLKGFVKVALATAVAWAAIKPLLGALANLTGVGPMATMVVLGHGIEKVGNRMILVVAVIGLGDFLWQRHQHMKSMRMSHEEVKREHKESEGDPHHKHERKRLHKELLEGRMINEVKKANFVVVNPTHIAVAVKYDRDKDAAPVVLAKGERLLAEKIKQAAREAGVPIFRDVGLARALRDVEEGDEIPEALYEAVAEILRVVYGGDTPGPPAPKPPPPPAITSDAPRSGWRRA
ncbi:MAG TPA: EscU/YscU/HrcU family type III secretion system export apparatus switch protein [Polyangia bacterium]